MNGNPQSKTTDKATAGAGVQPKSPQHLGRQLELRTLADVVAEIDSSRESRLTLRALDNDIQFLLRFCRAKTPRASVQELSERMANDWFIQRGIELGLNASGKQGRDPDPFGDMPIKHPAATTGRGGSVDTRGAVDADALRSLADVVAEIERSAEGRITLRIEVNHLQDLSKLCRAKTPPASLQELFERLANDWFLQRGIALNLNCSGKQRTDRDPFGDMPIHYPGATTGAPAAAATAGTLEVDRHPAIPAAEQSVKRVTAKGQKRKR